MSNISSVEAMSDLVNTEDVSNILQSLDDYQKQLEIFRYLVVKPPQMKSIQ